MDRKWQFVSYEPTSHNLWLRKSYLIGSQIYRVQDTNIVPHIPSHETWLMSAYGLHSVTRPQWVKVFITEQSYRLCIGFVMKLLYTICTPFLWYQKKLICISVPPLRGPTLQSHAVHLIHKEQYTVQGISLTHCGLVMPYGDIGLGRHWLRQCSTKPLPKPKLTYHRHGYCGTHLRPIHRKCSW